MPHHIGIIFDNNFNYLGSVVLSMSLMLDKIVILMLQHTGYYLDVVLMVCMLLLLNVYFFSLSLSLS